MPELPKVVIFCFFQDLVDKFTAAQDALIKIFLLSSPSHGQNLTLRALRHPARLPKMSASWLLRFHFTCQSHELNVESPAVSHLLS